MAPEFLRGHYLPTEPQRQLIPTDTSEAIWVEILNVLRNMAVDLNRIAGSMEQKTEDAQGDAD